jgi:hypothetical protein
VNLDSFNVVSGIVTIASFIFALILFIQDRTLKQSLEAGLTGLIGTLDTLAFVAKRGPSAEGARMQKLGLRYWDLRSPREITRFHC